MRNRSSLLAALLCAVSLTAVGVAFATPKGTHYVGRAGASDTYKLSFYVYHGYVDHFTFQSRCPGLAAGTEVPVRMKVRHETFGYHGPQFKITGTLESGHRARGTARDVTGDCDSTRLHWAVNGG